MTHFNHDWDTTKTPAVPVSVGDRYYAQDLNDDFNYLKHLPYEAILQGRTRGVMIPPTDTWDADSHSLTLSGGFGIVALNTPVLDTNEDFTIPPKTTSIPLYERIAFPNVTLTLPNDAIAHYIVATPTKQSLLQRGKALLSENYACRIRYDGVITVQDTAPTTNQIVIGLCHNDEYLLCKDFVLDQIVDNIKLHKWYGKNKITQSLIPLLQVSYNKNISNIETHITIDTVNDNGSYSIGNGTFNNCTISIGTISSGSRGINGGTFNNCTISIGTISSGSRGINGGTFNNCTISIGTAIGGSRGINSGTFNNCIISINYVIDSDSRGIASGTFNNCTISIGTISNNGYGIGSGIFNNCIISTVTISSGSVGINDNVNVRMYFVRATLPSVPTLSKVIGKGFVVNDTTIKGF